ncbi:MAG: monovalent cation/H(+) antiporter subunit G [Acidimicrobiales bacterium]|nr:monovalent cation/H(+) antiporter subunit G [Acidimicrobiales bacterium]MBO0893565.1 monovalent cation/H(+) antiporter subunit G [Acidimicrobiales bacterium]
MIVQDVVSDVLLGLAVITLLVSSLGVAVMDDVYQKIHFVTPASLVAPVLVALAVTVQEGYSENTTETWLAVLFVAIAGPVLSHATMRAARIRDTGDWRPGRGSEAGAGEREE